DTALVMAASPAQIAKILAPLREELTSKKYQFCLIASDADYTDAAGIAAIGSNEQVPEIEALITLLEKPGVNVAANLRPLARDKRPHYLRTLVKELARMRARCGRPHWLVVD